MTGMYQSGYVTWLFKDDFSTTAVTTWASNGTSLASTNAPRTGMLFPVGARVTWSAVLLAAFQWFQLVFGAISNVIVLLVMAWRRYKLQMVTQMLIASLSLAGLGITFSLGWVLPMTTISNGNWIYGSAGCKTFYLFQTFSLNVSIWTLVVLALERFLGVSKPSAMSVFKLPVGVAIVALIWIYGVACSVPIMLWSVTVPMGGSAAVICTIQESNQRSIFITTTRVINFFVPLGITWGSYVGIIFKIRRSAKKLAPIMFENGVSTKQQKTYSDQSRKVTLMCMIMALSFSIAWLPFQLGLIALSYTAVPNNVLNGIKTLACTDVCINPIVYGLMWKPFRTSLAMIHARISSRCWGQPSEETVNTIHVRTASVGDRKNETLTI